MSEVIEASLREASLNPASEGPSRDQRAEHAIVENILKNPGTQNTFGVKPYPDNDAFVILHGEEWSGPTLIRNEYLLISRLIEAQYGQWVDQYDKGKKAIQILVITGQPSSGKTVFNRLLQLKRISEHKKTIYTWKDYLYFFDGNKTWFIPEDITSKNRLKFEAYVIQFQRELWVLYDSAHNNALQNWRPSGRTMLYQSLTTAAGCPVFTVFTTSPAESRWNGTQIGFNPKIFYMMPWGKVELQKLLGFRVAHPKWRDVLLTSPLSITLTEAWENSPEYKLKTDVVASLQHFNKWGPYPLVQIDWEGTEDARKEWEGAITTKINSIPSLGELRHIKFQFEFNPEDSGDGLISHKIFRAYRQVAHPNTFNEGWDYILKVPPAVFNLVLQKFGTTVEADLDYGDEPLLTSL
ncbi:MAG: hypothetical protein M1820_001548 [Bogoriella megaspora]|nr:MAG: hypothetical protein M1820_001548 [Bogoriella megaspora]